MDEEKGDIDWWIIAIPAVVAFAIGVGAAVIIIKSKMKNDQKHHD